MARKIDEMKSAGEFAKAGALSFAEGKGRDYGCHFGMRSTRDVAIAEFQRGYDEAKFAAEHPAPEAITWGSKLVIAENAPHIYDALANAGLLKISGIGISTTATGKYEFNYYGTSDDSDNLIVEIVGSEAEIAPMDCKWRKIA